MKRRSFPEKPFFSWMAWGMLRACKRRWFLHNFGRDLPDPLGRQYFTERKLSYWQAFAGQLADDGVTETIRHFKKHRVWRQDMDSWLLEQAREYRSDSLTYTKAAENGDDLPYVKRQVLDRYFYNNIPDGAEHKRVLEEARQAVRNFYQTEIPARIETTPPNALMCDHKDGDFPWAEHDGVPVYAVYDFAIRLPERTTIFDWKTGKVTPEKEANALEQLHWYALYAMQAWHVEPEQIRIAPVFLAANYGYHETECDPVRLGNIQAEWKERHAEIKSKMNTASSIEVLQEEFPMTENLRECAGCVFHSCPGYQRVRDAQVANPVKFAILGESD